jgi:hypothetical protein
MCVSALWLARHSFQLMLRSGLGPVPHVGPRGGAGGLHQEATGLEAPPNGTGHGVGGTGRSTPVIDYGAGLEALLNCTEHLGGLVPAVHSGASTLQRWNFHPPEA